ncbi:hypothetical protein AB6A40_002881 [Gnathostoma spinigerum]|uniref:Hepcidin n=1 Tax=Gnathostoma spinigerum TaxID=75299 RepID=A0ABD6EHL2_9BILA
MNVFGFVLILCAFFLINSDANPVHDEINTALQLKGESSLTHVRTKRCCCCLICCCCCPCGFGKRKRRSLNNLRIKHLESVLNRF